ncbi:siderophore-interacting family protein [Mycobacterium xenopi 4042]|uniref:Siderophore-interacting family protein n=1 Tax=Mycobacterium xenopi 4042 TaxID=1299334 RepID=X8E907_MYCXE|nr:siderophore-interacting family protein [Mycobacterium xenopi 4042]
MNWIYRGGRADLVPEDRAGDHAPLIEAVKTTQWLPGQVHVFIHGEAQAVMHNLRPYIRKEREVDAQRASISGYWRRGRTEETFRQWKKELAEAEAAGSRTDRALASSSSWRSPTTKTKSTFRVWRVLSRRCPWPWPSWKPKPGPRCPVGVVICRGRCRRRTHSAGELHRI